MSLAIIFFLTSILATDFQNLSSAFRCGQSLENGTRVQGTNEDCKAYLFNLRNGKICRNITESWWNVPDVKQCAALCQNSGKCKQFVFNKLRMWCGKCLDANSNVYEDSNGTIVVDYDSDFSSYCADSALVYPKILYPQSLKRGVATWKGISNGKVFVRCTSQGIYELVETVCDSGYILSGNMCRKEGEDIKFTVHYAYNYSWLFILLIILLLCLLTPRYCKKRSFETVYYYLILKGNDSTDENAAGKIETADNKQKVYFNESVEKTEIPENKMPIQKKADYKDKDSNYILGSNVDDSHHGSYKLHENKNLLLETSSEEIEQKKETEDEGILDEVSLNIEEDSGYGSCTSDENNNFFSKTPLKEIEQKKETEDEQIVKESLDDVTVVLNNEDYSENEIHTPDENKIFNPSKDDETDPREYISYQINENNVNGAFTPDENDIPPSKTFYTETILELTDEEDLDKKLSENSSDEEISKRQQSESKELNAINIPEDGFGDVYYTEPERSTDQKYPVSEEEEKEISKENSNNVADEIKFEELKGFKYIRVLEGIGWKKNNETYYTKHFYFTAVKSLDSENVVKLPEMQEANVINDLKCSENRFIKKANLAQNQKPIFPLFEVELLGNTGSSEVDMLLKSNNKLVHRFELFLNITPLKYDFIEEVDHYSNLIEKSNWKFKVKPLTLSYKSSGTVLSETFLVKPWSNLLNGNNAVLSLDRNNEFTVDQSLFNQNGFDKNVYLEYFSSPGEKNKINIGTMALKNL